MLKRILPKEEKFFDLFDEIAAQLVVSVRELIEGMKNPSILPEKALLIREIENQADSITHKTLERLHNAFITPFDRHHIYSLVQGLDSVIDLVHAAAERFIIYDLAKIPDITLQLATKTQDAAIQVQKATAGLHNLKNTESLRQICAEIHRIENESDALFRESLSKLFREENDIKTLINLKEINEILEEAADCCEDLASLIESIILEYS